MDELLVEMEMYLGQRGTAVIIMMGVHLNLLGLERTSGGLIEESDYGVNETVGVPMQLTLLMKRR